MRWRIVRQTTTLMSARSRAARSSEADSSEEGFSEQEEESEHGAGAGDVHERWFENMYAEARGA